mmetsp:Transcript_1088/g.2207  ORF Transcript_1088/g.2207 Transcript_1088/m.2207 type:complete len:115 (+) Transcript_1088:66-410(+)|eukprot:CAMPEP_0197653980 /NCGR_PEP_ID=MMETSP1338-20131121/38096_1 /TAXON_ID=43686 ORGANISM="Pelagodinium beii, Strain RCC1491" /NCGR_SAMPLE_ID=MMETSP1338 /ASSEMBLY_ACC=CAM_ASM_000754 /LENGTH=114 /DNA_ID=CAMNT_0043229321 /DNA_START=57 /DNA_END=401 /DNA_ORIENTATION=-
MGNCNLVPSDEHNEIHDERLKEAVENMDAEEVSRCLDGGLPVNSPIDRHGHTILDKFAIEHHSMLVNAMNFKGKPQEATAHLMAMQEAAAQTLKVLMEHGAVLSAQSGAAKRGV